MKPRCTAEEFLAKRNGIIKTLIQIGLILVVLALIFFH